MAGQGRTRIDYIFHDGIRSHHVVGNPDRAQWAILVRVHDLVLLLDIPLDITPIAAVFSSGNASMDLHPSHRPVFRCHRVVWCLSVHPRTGIVVLPQHILAAIEVARVPDGSAWRIAQDSGC